DSTTDCLTDVDGDGLSPLQVGACYVLDMQDSWGDGWNGAALTIYVDGVMVDSGLPQDSLSQLAGTFYLGTGSAGTLSFCVEGTDFEMSYASGSFESENTYQLYDDGGILLFSDGPSPAIGSVYTSTITSVIPGSGSDCDDNDSSIGFEDGDSDGYPSCGGDCDDTDPNVFPDDLDGDGYSSCDGDCNDDPSDPTAININPGVVENYYNGVDENCDGLSDYDSDMDGEDSDQYGGTDCDDTNAVIGLGLPEICDSIDNDCDGLIDDDDTVDPAEVFNWYIDGDSDGYGDDSNAIAQCSPPSGYIADGGDCNDSDSSIYPGAVEVWYDGVDSDCDFMSDFDSDMDGEDSNQHGGSDCDDSDADLNSVDNDLDGFSTCDGDCDDDSNVTYPGAAYNDSTTECLTDSDGDGYGALESSCFEIELVDTGSYWDNAALTVFLDGVEWESFTNVGGGSETYSTCVDSGAISFEYICTSTYDCVAHTIYIYDENGNLLFEDGKDVTNTEPVQGEIFSTTSSDLATDCDDTDPSIGATDADNDGYIDCVDDCDSSDPLALGEELCFDGVDNNCDGLVDCDDSDCATVCTEYYCDDGIDNDNNGVSDCDDSQCEFDPACFEYECNDGLDDDNDGYIDCDDTDCDGELDCMELVCDDGVDDDVDGLADC
ncbi:MAG: MopE-related protein, partial [Myxococcota bacterium]|nr:MopE-related protein [Myxococcota bacterium]